MIAKEVSEGWVEVREGEVISRYEVCTTSGVSETRTISVASDGAQPPGGRRDEYWKSCRGCRPQHHWNLALDEKHGVVEKRIGGGGSWTVECPNTQEAAGDGQCEPPCETEGRVWMAGWIVQTKMT